MLCIWAVSWETLFEFPISRYRKNSKNGFFGSGPFFILTFTLSVVSASKGLADFLLHGPCKLLPTTGNFNGMGTVGYLLLFLNICFTMVAKGLVAMPWTLIGSGHAQEIVPFLWTLFNILPQLILVSLFSSYI